MPWAWLFRRAPRAPARTPEALRAEAVVDALDESLDDLRAALCKLAHIDEQLKGTRDAGTNGR